MTEWMPCPEPDCQGDARYAPPGRGHRYGCPYLGVPRGAIARGEALIAGDPDWMNVTQMSQDTVLMRRAATSARKSQSHWQADLLMQAADTIERLRAENDELTRRLRVTSEESIDD